MTNAPEQRALKLAGAPKPEPLLQNLYITACVVNGEEEFLVPERFFAETCIPHPDSSRTDQIRTILPGLRIPSGSSAIFIVRMTLTASPCSAMRKPILP